MDPKMHPLTAVTKLLKTIPPAAGGTYCLYAEGHEMHICRCRLVPKDLPIIAHITSLDMSAGFTPDKWHAIDARIRTFIKQGILEWKVPKPLHPKTQKSSSVNCSKESKAPSPNPSKSGTTQSPS